LSRAISYKLAEITASSILTWGSSLALSKTISVIALDTDKLASLNHHKLTQDDQLSLLTYKTPDPNLIELLL
jgi:hypothetical protein